MKERGVSESKAGMRNIAISEIGPTKAQTTAAEVSIYLQSVRALKAAARTRARAEHPLLGRRKFRRELKNELMNLYVTSLTSPMEQKERTAPTYEELGTPHGTAKVIFEEAVSKLGAIETETRMHASELGKVKRAKIASQSALLLRNRLSEEQSKALVTRAGYTDAEAKIIHGKVATALALDLPTTAGAIALVTAGTAMEKIYQFIPDVTNPKLLATYAPLYVSAGLLTWANMKLMDNPAVKTTANVLATAGYYFTPRVFADNWKRFAQWAGVTAGTFVPTLLGESTTWTAIHSLAGRQGIVGRNAASTAVDLLTVAGDLGWIALKRRQARKSGAEK